MRSRRVVLAALALAACGSSHDALFDRNEGICASIVNGTTTIGDVSARFGITAQRGACLPDWKPVASGDLCPANPAVVCVLAFEFFSSDDRACRGGLGGSGGCAYRCEARIAGQPAQDLSNVVCAHEFITGQ